MRTRLDKFPGADNYPGRVILTDDPMRAKMLVAHHLEYASLSFEQGDVSAYSGSYKGVPVAVVSTGFGKSDTLLYLRAVIESGATNIVYIGKCTSSAERLAPRSVILAIGGSQTMLEKARDAAGLYDIRESAEAVLPPGAYREEVCIFEEVTGGLYELAQAYGVEALAILTVSENTATGESMDEHEVRSRFYGASRLSFELLATV